MMKRFFATFVVLCRSALHHGGRFPHLLAGRGPARRADHPPSVATTPPAANPSAPKPASNRGRSPRTRRHPRRRWRRCRLRSMQLTQVQPRPARPAQAAAVRAGGHSIRPAVAEPADRQPRSRGSSEALTEKQQLQDKVDRLELQASQHTAVPADRRRANLQGAPTSKRRRRAEPFAANHSMPPRPGRLDNPPATPTIETVRARLMRPPVPPPSTYLPPEGGTI